VGENKEGKQARKINLNLFLKQLCPEDFNGPD
jgi:hypothetical protein